MQNGTIEKIKTGLLSNLDSENNVTNIQGALESIKILEEYPMTKELLEQTRIGKHVNELRKKTTHKELSRRAKDLVKKWQILVNASTGANQPFKKDDLSRKNPNGVHTLISQTPSPTLSTCSSVSGSRSNLNGSFKNSDNKLLAKHISAELAKNNFSQPSSKLPSAASSPALSDVATTKNSDKHLHNNGVKKSANNNLKNNSTIPNNGKPSQIIDSKNAFQIVNNQPKNNSVKKYDKISPTLELKAVGQSSQTPSSSSASTSFVKNASVIKNGASKSLAPDLSVTSCDKMLSSSRKRQLDVPFANVNNVNKKIKITAEDINDSTKKKNGMCADLHNKNNVNPEKSSAKLNGSYTREMKANVDSDVKSNNNNNDNTVNSLENKVFSWKVSSTDLKCTIRSCPVSKSVNTPTTSPSLSQQQQLLKSTTSAPSPGKIAKTNSSVANSSLQSYNNAKKFQPVVKNSKVETTVQLIQKLQSNGSLGSLPSPTISKITSNQFKKEPCDEELTVVPAGAKPRPHKKRNKIHPPAESSTDLLQVKNEMMQKFLQTTQNISSYSNDSFDSNSNDITKMTKLKLTNTTATPMTSTTVNNTKVMTNLSKKIDVTKLEPDSEEYRKELLRNPWAFLPPLDSLSIADEPDTDNDTTSQINEPPKQIEDDDIDKVLVSRWPGVNGQFDYKNDWQPWTNTYSVKSYSGDFLHILPYTSLDF